MCVPCDNGLINLRVGAIIIKDGAFLMVGNRKRPEYLSCAAADRRLTTKRALRRRRAQFIYFSYQNGMYWLTKTTSAAKTMETIDSSLIRMLMDGPEVSLKGSPTVSPTTAALC